MPSSDLGLISNVCTEMDHFREDFVEVPHSAGVRTPALTFRAKTGQKAEIRRVPEVPQPGLWKG